MSVGAEAKEGASAFVARCWASRAGFSWPLRTLLSLPSLVVIPGAMLFVVAALATGDWGHAVDVLLGLSSPYAGRADPSPGWTWLTVPLAIYGYLLLPATVGALVGEAMQRRLNQVVKGHEDVVERLEKRLDQALLSITDPGPS